MVNTRGARPSIDGQDPSDVPPSPSAPVDDKADVKQSHPLENDEHGSISPRASKKRKIEPEDDDTPFSTQPTRLPHDTAGNQIEEELASALGAGMVDPNERPADNGPSQSENSAESATAPSTGTDMDTDMATVISSIMNHAERVEEQCAMGEQQLGEDTSNQEAPKGVVFVKANSHLKIQSLPILDNLSTQILSLLAKSSYQDITSLVSEPESENGQAYATMRSLFDHTKKVYSTKKSFLSPVELELTEPAQIDVIRKANLASFVSSIFGTQEIGFSELNENFIDVFVPEGGRLLKVQGALFLELKTQAFIASMNSNERTRTEILFDLFPEDLEQRLMERHTANRALAPSEADFAKRAASRRDILLADINNEEALKALPDKYHWEDFLRDLSSYITKNFDSISHQQTKKATKGRQPSQSSGDAQENQGAPLQSQFSVAPQPPDVPVDKNMHGDLVARAARAAQIALQGHGLRRSQQQSQQQQHQQQQPQPPAQPQPPQPGQQPQPYHPPQQSQPQQQPGQVPPSYSMPPPQHSYSQSPAPQGYQPQQQQHQQPPGQLTFQQSPLQANFQHYNHGAPMSGRPTPGPGAPANHGYMPGIPHYSQSQPTQVLYERARMAASAKSSPSSRKSGLPSQRRPWTTEEENALMAGLDRVKGPHWSQILAMFGPGGTISEALKDRNQVQLKDKARNLKLFFLKSGIEVPYYLKFVTGELKTRAPAQAAKREARERQKKQGEEDKAHVEGIKGMMALAGAHSQPVAINHGHEATMSASPLPSHHDNQFDQTAEQNLMQTLGQEVHGESFGQPQHHQHQDQLNSGMHMGQ